MKCDKLKPLVFSISDLAYVDEPTPQPNFQNPHDHAVYKATEVEELIEELEERITNGDKDFEFANNQNERLLQINRHNKNKRCLAMALWCESKVYHIRRTPLCDMSEHEYWQYENDFWQRWKNRWQELSEKFSEEK